MLNWCEKLLRTRQPAILNSLLHEQKTPLQVLGLAGLAMVLPWSTSLDLPVWFTSCGEHRCITIHLSTVSWRPRVHSQRVGQSPVAATVQEGTTGCPCLLRRLERQDWDPMIWVLVNAHINKSGTRFRLGLHQKSHHMVGWHHLHIGAGFSTVGSAKRVNTSLWGHFANVCWEHCGANPTTSSPKPWTLETAALPRQSWTLF